MDALGPFRSVGTFLGVPRATTFAGCRIAGVGIPFDMGAHPTRVGARTGPDHVRAESALVAEHMRDDFGIDVAEELGFVDCGDVATSPGDVDEAFAAIEHAMDVLCAASVVPLTVGGDGAVTLPQLRALSRAHGRLALLHFDAHTDAYPTSTAAHKYDNANAFVHSVREELLDMSAAVHVGLRDTLSRDGGGAVGVARDMGYEAVTMRDLDRNGVPSVAERLRDIVGGRPVYLCWDMDVFDPSVAPGVVTPAWGGLSVREGLALLEALRGLNVVAFDVNTVSPPHDLGGQTGSLAAQVMLECLFIAYESPLGTASV